MKINNIFIDPRLFPTFHFHGEDLKTLFILSAAAFNVCFLSLDFNYLLLGSITAFSYFLTAKHVVLFASP